MRLRFASVAGSSAAALSNSASDIAQTSAFVYNLGSYTGFLVSSRLENTMPLQKISAATVMASPCIAYNCPSWLLRVGLSATYARSASRARMRFVRALEKFDHGLGLDPSSYLRR